jgi:hypothetical protein
MPSIQPFAWRHFCVDSADITHYVDINKGGYILIPQHYRIQGAYPVNPINLVLEGLQGGFLCVHDSVSSPIQGTLQHVGRGWFYKPSIGAHTISPTVNNPNPDDDSFNFVLSNLGQYSPIQTVHIKFLY